MIMTHGDDKGLVLPPKVAGLQVVVVPILFKVRIFVSFWLIRHPFSGYHFDFHLMCIAGRKL